MKISSTLKLVNYVPAVMAAVVFVTLLFSYQQTVAIQTTGDNVRQIRNSITDINQNTFSYIFRHEDRSKAQFATASDTLTHLVSVTSTANQQQRSLLSAIQSINLAMKADFSRLVANYDNRSAVNQEDFERAESIIVESLTSESYLADNDATLLRSMVDTGIRDTQVRTIILVFSAVLLTTLAVTPFLIRTRRRITKSLNRLNEGAALVGSGNLDAKVEEKGEDELTDVSRAFNRMTSDLKAVTASKSELEREIEERKKAEENLSQANQRLVAHIDCSPLAVIEFDSDFRITRWSKEAEHIFGWTSQEVLGKTISEMKWVYKEDVEHVERVSNGFTDKSSPAGVSVNRNYRKDGTVICCEWYNSSIYDSSGKLISVLSQVLDITESKRTLRALQESEERFLKAFQESPVAKTIAHLPDGRWVEVNNSFLRMFEYTREEVIGHTSAELNIVSASERARILKLVNETGDQQNVELKAQTKSGKSVIVLSSNGKFVLNGQEHALSTLVDITERKEAEQDLRESEQRWATTLASVGDAVIATDTAGKITFMNGVAENLTGWMLTEASGAPVEQVFKIINEKTRQAVESPVASVLRSGRVIGLANHTILVRKDGGEIPIDDSGAPIMAESGKVSGVVLVFRDVTARRKAEEKVQRLADQWQLTFNSIADPVSIQDTDFKLVRVNKAYAEAVGMDEEQLIGRKCYEVIHGLKCHIEGCPHQNTLESGKSSTVEFFEPRLGAYIEASTSPILDKNGEVTGTIHIAKNITARKKAEEEIKRNEARLGSLVKLSPIKRGSIQELLDRALDEAIRLTGSEIGYIYHYYEDRKEFVLNTWSREVADQCSIMEPQTVYKLEKTGVWGEAVRQRKAIVLNDYQLPNFLKKGYPAGHAELKKFLTVPVFSQGKLVAVVGVANKSSDYDDSDIQQLNLFMDSIWKIVERQRAEDALELERDKLTGLLNSMEDGVAIISADFELEYINPALEVQYGPIEGRKCHAYFNDRGDVCPWCRNAEIFAGKTSRSDVKSSKTGKTYEVTYAPLKNEDGTTSKLTVWHDITERKKVEQLKDDFIGMVSHELRTPLTIITGAVHTAMLEGLPEDERDMLLKDAAVGAESLGDILSNLLELSRFQASRLVLASETVNVRKAVNEVVEQLKRKSTAHRLINEAPESISLVADKVRIERILHNLIENAIKYSPEGGDINIIAWKEDGSVIVGVCDRGIGISTADQIRLFQPFERLERLNDGIKGLGLGLVVCRRLVEAHNGRMWVESEPGKGSTFYFSLPMKVKDST